MNFEGDFWDDPDDIMEMMYQEELDWENELENEIEDELEDAIDEDMDSLISDELDNLDYDLDRLNVTSISEYDDSIIQDVFDMDDLEIAFMLGFGDTMVDEGPPRKADRHRKQEGEPIPLVNPRRVKRGLAEEFLLEFNMRHSR